MFSGQLCFIRGTKLLIYSIPNIIITVFYSSTIHPLLVFLFMKIDLWTLLTNYMLPQLSFGVNLQI